MITGLPSTFVMTGSPVVVLRDEDIHGSGSKGTYGGPSTTARFCLAQAREHSLLRAQRARNALYLSP